MVTARGAFGFSGFTTLSPITFFGTLANRSSASVKGISRVKGFSFMIASRRYDYEGISSKLRSLGCTETGKVVPLKSQPHHLWLTPWRHPFMVPATFATDWEIEQIIKRDFDGTRPRFDD